MADLGDMLMNQIKQSNLAQTQLANDYSNQANTLAQMPQANPMNDFMGSLSMGVLGAPSHLSTMEAIGQAMPGAQNAFQQTQQQNANRMTQAMEYKRLAASTLSAVAKFNLEYGLKREELGVKHAGNQETERHNKATEYNQMLQLANKPTQSQKMAKEYIAEKTKLAQLAKDNAYNVDKLYNASKKATGFLGSGFFVNQNPAKGASESVDPRYNFSVTGNHGQNVAKARENKVLRIRDELIGDRIDELRTQGATDEEIKMELEKDLPNIIKISEDSVGR